MKRFTAIILCICITALLFAGCDSISSKGKEIKSINDISVNPLSKVKSSDDEYKSYDNARSKLIDKIIKQSSSLNNSIKKIEKQQDKERIKFITIIDAIKVLDDTNLAAWLLDELNLIVVKRDAVTEMTMPKSSEKSDNELLEFSKNIKITDSLISEITFLNIAYETLNDTIIADSSDDELNKYKEVLEQWQNTYDKNIKPLLINMIENKMILQEMMAALYKADEMAALSEMDEIIAKLKVIGDQIIAFEVEGKLNAEDMAFLKGVWGFYYTTTLAQFVNAGILETPIKSYDKSMGMSDVYLLSSGFSIPYMTYSIDDAAELLSTASNSNGSLYDAISDTASQFAGQMLNNASQAAADLVSDFRALQRGISGTIGVIGKGVQLASVPIDAAYDSVFGTGQKWGVMGQTIDDLAKEAEREINEGRLGVSELKDMVMILDEGTKKAGSLAGWLAETATNNKTIGTGTAYITRLIGSSLTGLGKAAAKLSDPTSTPEDIFESMATIVLTTIGGDTLIKGSGIADKGIHVATALLGDSWKTITKNFVTKWSQDIGKAVIRQLDGIDPDKFKGEWDEMAINKMLDLLRRASGEENIKDLGVEGMESMIESMIDIAGLTDSDLDDLVWDAIEDMKDDEGEEAAKSDEDKENDAEKKTTSKSADNNSDKTKQNGTAQLTAVFDFTPAEIERFEGLSVINHESLDGFLSEFFGFSDGIDYDALEYRKMNIGDDTPGKNYIESYSVKDGDTTFELGWRLTYKENAIYTMHYLTEFHAKALFFIKFQPDGNIESITVALNEYEAVIRFKDAALTFANISFNNFATNNSANYYEDGSLKKFNIIEDKIVMESFTYYQSGSIKAYNPYHKNRKLNGVQLYYYENGNVNTETTYIDNEKNGVSKTYYENGTLKHEAHYVNNELHGIKKSWDESGSLIYAWNYINDERQD